jgi:hypothetical protein
MFSSAPTRNPHISFAPHRGGKATVGCSHDDCKFCSLYHGTCFRVATRAEIEHDLKVAAKYQPRARRVFLTGANPFVLSYNKLVNIALMIHDYLPDERNRLVAEIQNILDNVGESELARYRSGIVSL